MTKQKLKEKQEEIRSLRSKLRMAEYKAKERIRHFEDETRRQLITLVVGAFSFAAALFWRDAVQLLMVQNFNIAIGEKAVWHEQALIAIVVTLFAVLVTVVLTRPKEPGQEDG